VQEIATRQEVLTRNGLPDATWVETGTYRGETTAFLAKTAKMVYSIEPGPKLFSDARDYFRNHANVEIINGLSERALPQLLPTLAGNICFWLDGHYSEADTFKGPLDTPITVELDCIGNNLFRMSKIAVMIDDAHLFNGRIHIYGAYPGIDEIIAWAQNHKLSWHIEHDIFIAKNY
jgi:hypothetical protein